MAERTIKALKNQYDITLVYFYKSDYSRDLGVKTICLEKGYKTNLISQIFVTFKRCGMLNKIKKQNHFDVSLAFGEVCSITNILTTKKYEKCITSIHGLTSVPNSIIKCIIYKMLFGLSDEIIAVSNGLKEIFEKNINIKKPKVTVIHNPFDIKEIALKQQEYSFCPDGKLNFVAVGRLAESKGFSAIIKMFAKVEKSLDAKLYILGDGEQMQSLKQLAAQLDIANKIEFLGATKNIYPILSKADIFLNASLNEGFGNTIVEALICNTPVITTCCLVGPREILSPSLPALTLAENVELAEYGILIPAQQSANGNSLQVTEDEVVEYGVAAISALIQDKNLYNKYKQNAKNRALDFDIENYKQQLINLIEK